MQKKKIENIKNNERENVLDLEHQKKDLEYDLEEYDRKYCSVLLCLENE